MMLILLGLKSPILVCTLASPNDDLHLEHLVLVPAQKSLEWH